MVYQVQKVVDLFIVRVPEFLTPFQPLCLQDSPYPSSWGSCGGPSMRKAITVPKSSVMVRFVLPNANMTV